MCATFGFLVVGGRAYELMSGTRCFGSDRKGMGMTVCLLYTIDMNQ